MKYEIIDQVSRFVKRFGMIMDPETMNKARDEAEEYYFRKISEDHYGVIHNGKMYIIIEHDGEIGCSCEDMQHNRMDGSVCKHIIAFSRLLSTVVMKIDKLDEAHLVNVCGWTGKDLHPEIELGGPGARIQEDMKPEPKASIPPDPDLDIGVDDPLPEPGKENDKPLGDRKVSDQPEETKQKEEVKKMEGNTTWDQEAWDKATQGSFVSYGEDGIAVVLFTANDFELGKPDQWGRIPCDFSVIQHKKSVVLSVGSIRLMQALKEILPIEGRLIKIIRTGEGTGTTYQVQDVTDTEVL